MFVFMGARYSAYLSLMSSFNLKNLKFTRYSYYSFIKPETYVPAYYCTNQDIGAYDFFSSGFISVPILHEHHIPAKSFLPQNALV